MISCGSQSEPLFRFSLLQVHCMLYVRPYFDFADQALSALFPLEDF